MPRALEKLFVTRDSTLLRFSGEVFPQPGLFWAIFSKLFSVKEFRRAPPLLARQLRHLLNSHGERIGGYWQSCSDIEFAVYGLIECGRRGALNAQGSVV